MDNELNRRHDLLADRSRRQIQPGHQHHGFQSSQRIAGTISMNGCQTSVMPGIHRLQHVQSLTAANFADDNSIGPHAQSIDNQIARHDTSMSFNIRRASFHANNMVLVQNQFGRIFDRDNAFMIRNRFRDGSQKRRLARACAAGNQDILATSHDQLHKLAHRRGEHAQLHQVISPQSTLAKSANRESRSVNGDRR